MNESFDKIENIFEKISLLNEEESSFEKQINKKFQETRKLLLESSALQKNDNFLKLKAISLNLKIKTKTVNKEG